jgi:aminoglycoside phosphotransferase (APT) family kinase protein
MSFDPSATGQVENEAAPDPLGNGIPDASGDESTSDCDSCASSQTSTDLYDHEPFETFAHKVHSLLTTIFPDDLPIQVKRVSGGSYNRVVCGVLGYDQQSPRRVIVRIPRSTYCSPVNEVAILRFLRSTTAIPVPSVLHFHMSSSNIISDPFMILEHLPGTCLGDVYDDLLPHIKKSIVRSLVCLLKQLSEVTFNAIGTLLSASPDGFGIQIGHVVNVVNETQNAPPPSPARAPSIRDYLEERWSFFVTEEQRRNPGDTFDLRFTSGFRAAMNILPIPDADIPACIVLHHTDLAPRNIFIDIQSGAITGVLDWELAESAPVEAAWQMPAWLWDRAASGSNQLKWVSPDDIPLDPQAAQIRLLFLDEIEEAIPGFVQTVRHNKLIFELLTFARLGLHSEEVIYHARDFLATMNIEIAPVA